MSWLKHKTVWFGLVILFSLGIGTGWTGNRTISISRGDYILQESAEGTTRIIMEGFGNLGTPGHPILPSKLVYIELPEDAEIIRVTITSQLPVRLSGTYKIPANPPLLPETNN